MNGWRGGQAMDEAEHIYHNHSDMENMDDLHGMSYGTPAGDSTIPTRADIGLMPRRKSTSGGRGGVGGKHVRTQLPSSSDHVLHYPQENCGNDRHQRPPSAISVTSPVPNHAAGRRSEVEERQQTTKSVSHTALAPRSHASSLDLKHNDNGFQVIATLIVDRFQDQLRSGVESIIVTATDKQYLDRIVPRKRDFIQALRWRLVDCPEHSTQPIHVVTRQCRALGLQREGNQNLLYASIGSLVLINSAETTIESNLAAIQSARPHGADELARQQLLAELREASTLMAESVTPEASQFWRKHVIELQSKLRAMQEKAGDANAPANPGHEDAADIMKRNERLLASLWQNTGYVPPSQDELASVSNSMVESRAPSVAQNNVNVADPRDMDLPMVDVVAPADLPAGYQFEAAIDNNIFVATVPMGGVKKGQTFSSYMKDIKETGIPYGHWKDGLFDFLKHGPTHPMLLNSFLCPLLALAHVMARLGLDYTGQPLSDNARRRGAWSARGTMMSIIVCWLGLNFMIIFGFEVKLRNFVSLSFADILSIVMVNATFAFFTVYATVNTRRFLQEKYQIDSNISNHQTENILLSVFCLPLTVAQMGRHTASYDQYNGVCCNETGIPKADGNQDGLMIG